MEPEVAQQAKRVVRVFQRYTAEERCRHVASHRLGHRQRQAVGQFFYTHPDVPGRAFSTRGQAAEAAVRSRKARPGDTS